MIKEAIGTGASIEEAKTAALEALNAPEAVEEVKIDVIDLGKKKTLGIFGGSPAKVRAYYEVEDDRFSGVREYIMSIIGYLGIEKADIETTATDDSVSVNISCGDDYGSVIGRRGETLDAIQYLVRLFINRDYPEYKHISLNVGNYREKREATLKSLAKKNAARVRKYGRSVVLEPMNPYERRIIHTTIQEVEGVTSHSVGSDESRKVVIALADGVKPTNGSGYQNKGRSDGRGRHGQGKKYDSSAASAPSREPRNDTEGVLYGKIEINK